jgi:hypothetical protein
MTAPDRGATYQIALASTGSSTHDAWYLRRESARGGEPTFAEAMVNGEVAPTAGIPASLSTQFSNAPAVGSENVRVVRTYRFRSAAVFERPSCQ